MRLLCSILLLAMLSGCASKSERIASASVMDYIAGDYVTARQRLEPIAAKPDKNFVLNNVRLGSACLAMYDLDEAERAFLRAYEVQNSVGVNTGGRSLGATMVDEGVKIWKGEPFERAMTNFYLGLIYYMRQDYHNARAAFENALFKLRDYGDQEAKENSYVEVENNFPLGLLMLAKAQQRVGKDDEARKNFERVARIRPQLAGQTDFDWNRKSNLLLVIDFGYGPKKIQGSHSVISFAPTPAEAGPIPGPTVVVDGRQAVLGGLVQAPIDLLVLAQDRRWQSIDTIRVVKSAVGTGLLAGGIYEGTRSGGNDEAALAMLAAGLLLKATSQADIRQWEMLPRTVFLLPLHVRPGSHDVTVNFPTIPGLSQTWKGLPVPPQGEATYYFRMQLNQPGPFTWPPQAPPPPPAPVK